jgi:hypothetical protein
LLFCNRKYAVDFFDAIYLLDKERVMSHLYVEIDHSLKCATPKEGSAGLGEKRELIRSREKV